MPYNFLLHLLFWIIDDTKKLLLLSNRSLWKVYRFETKGKRGKGGLISHCSILSKIGTDFSMSQKSNSMLEFQAHICWVITVDHKVRLGQVDSEFDWKRPNLTRSNCLHFP